MNEIFQLCPTKYHKCPRCALVGLASKPLLCPCGVAAVPHYLPGHQPATTFDNLDATRQRALFDGLDCLPGQQDLF